MFAEIIIGRGAASLLWPVVFPLATHISTADAHLCLQLRLAVHFPWSTLDFEWYDEFSAVDRAGWSDHWYCLLTIEASFAFHKSRLDLFLVFSSAAVAHGRVTSDYVSPLLGWLP